MEGTPIYELVSMAYQFPVVGAFWPLVCGLYWKRSTTQGAIWSIVLGMSDLGAPRSRRRSAKCFPSVLGGFLLAGVGMVVGSLLPTQGNVQHRARTATHGPHSHAGHGHHSTRAAAEQRAGVERRVGRATQPGGATAARSLASAMKSSAKPPSRRDSAAFCSGVAALMSCATSCALVARNCSIARPTLGIGRVLQLHEVIAQPGRRGRLARPFPLDPLQHR